ncbi:hypothetical protein [Acinetobacter radioresistens]|uniref:hypothetical protein n=1 Tax=Acinetobacter radioresistens TaxID=40216 RepID=UPI0022473E04|nr:hypothetical protein [Acinetobacter radioresistens]MCX0332716.1 hypothetical protein [Acinetobacter radioresistens]
MKINNSKLIRSTFDEMIARWTAIGYYREELVSAKLMTNLDMLRSFELFLSDIESIRGDLFVKNGAHLRNTEFGNKIQSYYDATTYAVKWFPFDFLFNKFLIFLGTDDYFFVELNSRFFIFFYYFNINIEIFEKINDENFIYSYKFDEINGVVLNRVKMELVSESMQNVNCIDDMDESQKELINQVVKCYKMNAKSNKINNRMDSSFEKKRNGYIEYFFKLLNKYKGVYAFSVNFYIKNTNIGFDFPKIRNNFFNTLRGHSKTSSIVGYMGTWEYCERYGFFFRAVFFVPKKLIVEPQEFLDGLIYLWQTFNNSKSKERQNLIFKAELSNISESIQSLKTPYRFIGQKNQTLLESFVDSVINYTVLAEKYFFPAELQIFIFEHMLEHHKVKNSHNKFIIDKLKNSFSRSFRGHL